MPPRIDPDAIARLRRFGGDKLLHEMIDLMLSGAPERLETVRSAADAGQAEPARAALHSLKSTSGQMGATALHDACARGERLAAAGDVVAVAALVPELEAEFETVRTQLTAIRHGDA